MSLPNITVILNIAVNFTLFPDLQKIALKKGDASLMEDDFARLSAKNFILLKE
jgi:hypothetical protein